MPPSGPWASRRRGGTITGMIRHTTAAVLLAACGTAVAAADREPVPPWEWRAGERERRAAKREAAVID